MTVPSGWCAIRIATSPMPASGPSRNSCTRHAGCSPRSDTQSSIKAREPPDRCGNGRVGPVTVTRQE